MLKIMLEEIMDISTYWGIGKKMNCEAKMEIFEMAGELAGK